MRTNILILPVFFFIISMSDLLNNEYKVRADTIYHVCLKKLKEDEEIKGIFKYNQFTQSVRFCYAPPWNPEVQVDDELTNIDLIQLRSFWTLKYNFSPSMQNLSDAVTSIAQNKKYHPIRDYILNLKWDGTHRLNRWLEKICHVKTSPYIEAIGSKVFCAAIRRVFEPGCKFDHMMILEGAQGIGKSTLLELMSGGAQWHSSINFQQSTKETVEIMRGKWIIEIEEMGGFSHQQVERTKAMISGAKDRTRLAYQYLAEDFPRQSIFIGTLNPMGENKYFNDYTGNRRYWPVACNEAIDLLTFKEIRDQLFAEAYIRYKEGEKLWLDDKKIESVALEEQEKRQHEDPWTETVKNYLEKKKQEFEPQVTIYEIIKEAIHIPDERITRSHSTRVGFIVNDLGWIKMRENNKDRKGYYVPPETPIKDKWG